MVFDGRYFEQVGGEGLKSTRDLFIKKRLFEKTSSFLGLKNKVFLQKIN
jgi:hypothetical protein